MSDGVGVVGLPLESELDSVLSVMSAKELPSSPGADTGEASLNVSLSPRLDELG